MSPPINQYLYPLNFITQKPLHLKVVIFFLIAVASSLTTDAQHAASPQQDKSGDIQIRFLDEYVIKNNLTFDNSRVGGLSGIDYNAHTDEYYAVSDDEARISPVRFYTFKIRLGNNKIDTVIFTKKTNLKNKDGLLFPRAPSRKETVDPEALRLWNGNFIWSSEGVRTLNGKDTVLLNPKVFLSDSKGNYIDTFVLPDQVKTSIQQKGVRGNGSFEGLDVSGDGRYLYVSTEEPLLQDDHRAGPGDSSAIIRILQFDLKTKKTIAQYGYRVDPVAYPPKPAGAFRLNGVSDILWLGNNKLLVVERSFSSGRLGFTIKVFLADLSAADDISSFESVKGKKIKLISKKLLFNMDDLKGIYPDNIEGVTFGPVLPNGKKSLIFIADNNFKFFEKNQLLLFEVTGY